MNMFSTAGRTGENLDNAPERNWVGYGIHILAITGYEIKEARTGSKQVSLKFETPKVTDPDFKADQNAKRGGKVGTALFGPYLAKQDQIDEFNDKVALIARKLGISAKVDAIQATDIDDFMRQFVEEAKFIDAYWKLCGREYEKKKGGTGTINEVARFGFIKSLEEAADVVTDDDNNITEVVMLDKKSSKMTFDKANQYDYKVLEESTEAPTQVEEPQAAGTPLWKQNGEATATEPATEAQS